MANTPNAEADAPAISASSETPPVLPAAEAGEASPTPETVADASAEPSVPAGEAPSSSSVSEPVAARPSAPIPEMVEGTTARVEASVQMLDSFDPLPMSDELRRALADVGWKKPTPVQVMTFEPMTHGRDVLVQSHTGSGKTGAFCIPWLAGRFEPGDPKETGVQLIVVTPTRELAKQVCVVLRQLGEPMGVQALEIYGGTAMQPQLTALSRGVHAVVGTPGRILDHIRRRSLNLSKVRMAVLDEADEMLSMGFLEDIHNILDACGTDRQTTLFSATVPSDIKRISRRYMRDPENIMLSGDQVAAAEILHTYYSVSGTMKIRDLLDVIALEEPRSALVFCNTREETNVVASALRREGHKAEPLSSDLTQAAREKVMGRMRLGQLRFLVATDVASRGIDISHISHVINYSFPEHAESYIHRTGRTGRAGRAGLAINLIGPQQLGSFYNLKLHYPSLEFEERNLPPAEELARQRAETKLDQVSAMFPELVSPEWTLLARNLMKDPRGEQVIAYLLSEAISAKVSARTQRLDEESGLEYRRDVEPAHDRDDRGRGRGRDRDRGGGRGRDRGRDRDRDRDQDRGRDRRRGERDRDLEAAPEDQRRAPAVDAEIQIEEAPRDEVREARRDDDGALEGEGGQRRRRRRHRFGDDETETRARHESPAADPTDDGAGEAAEDADMPVDADAKADVEGTDDDDQPRRRRRRRRRRGRGPEAEADAGTEAGDEEIEGPIAAASVAATELTAAPTAALALAGSVGAHAGLTEADDEASPEADDVELVAARPGTGESETDPASLTSPTGRRRRRRRRRRGGRGSGDEEGAETQVRAKKDDAPEERADAGGGEAGRRKRRRRRGRRRGSGAEPGSWVNADSPGGEPLVPEPHVSQEEIVIDIDEAELEVVRDQFGEIDELDELTLRGRRRGVIETLSDEVELVDMSTRDANVDDADGADGADDDDDDGDETVEAKDGADHDDGTDDEDDARPERKRRRRRRRKKKAAPAAPPELTAPPHKDFWEVWAQKFTYQDFEDAPFFERHNITPEPELPAIEEEDLPPVPSRNAKVTEAAEDTAYYTVRLNLGRKHGKKAAHIRELFAEHFGLGGKVLKNLTVGEASTRLRLGASSFPKVAAGIEGLVVDQVELSLTVIEAPDEAGEDEAAPVAGASSVHARAEAAPQDEDDAAPQDEGDDAPSEDDETSDDDGDDDDDDDDEPSDDDDEPSDEDTADDDDDDEPSDEDTADDDDDDDDEPSDAPAAT